MNRLEAVHFSPDGIHAGVVRNEIFAQTPEYNFVRFSEDKEYIGENRSLLKKALSLLPPGFVTIVDSATGNGVGPKIISSLSQELGRMARVIGIDPDRYAIENARNTTPGNPFCSVEFIQGFAQDTDSLVKGRIPPEGIDMASILNAIHEIPTQEAKEKALESMTKIIKVGGLLVINSAFTTIAMGEVALKYGRWKLKAFSLVGGRVDKSIEPIKIHTPEEYVKMVKAARLEIAYEGEKVVQLSKDALCAISQYPAFIEGVFGNMVGTEKLSLKDKSDALIKALDELGITQLPRVWYEVIAQKPLSAAA